jgi:4-hydroxybenzoate polyprenyltransferase
MVDKRIMPVAVLRLLRPGDWIKNSFVLVPVVFWFGGAGRGATPDAIRSMLGLSLIAFIAFCMAASGWYAINDALDASEDRLHPVKRRRPVASGALSAGMAFTIGGALGIGSLAIAALGGSALVWVIATYLGLQVLYNAVLKRVGFVDVATIATGFCLRAVAGAVAIAVPVSVWLLLCVFFLTTYLGFIKRTCDLAAASKEEGSQWRQRAKYASVDELNWLLAVSGGMTVLMYLMYTLSAHASSLFGARSIALALLSPLVLMAVHCFYRRALAGQSDSPLAALRDDRTLAWAVGLFALGIYGALYSDAVDALIRRVLLVV